MIKLSIPATFLNSVSGSIAGLAATIDSTINSHAGLKAHKEARLERNAKIMGKSIEEYRKESLECQAKKAAEFVAKLPFFHNILEQSKKIGYVTKVDETLEIGVNEDYLLDCVQAVVRVTAKMAKPMADIICVFEDDMEYSENIEKKWFGEDEPTIESKVISESEVPTHIVEQMKEGTTHINGWDLDLTSSVKELYFLDENQEDFIDLVFIVATKNGQEVNVVPAYSKVIIESEMTLKDTAKKTKLPITLVKAIRAHYNKPELLDA